MAAKGNEPGEQPVQEVWTVKRVLDWTVGYLKEQGSETPRLDAEVLLSHVRKCPRIKLYTDFDSPLTDDERLRMRELVKRRAAAEPVAYLVGYREFFSLRFHVTADVFIPRPDTETLVVAALDVVKSYTSPVKILDLCSGSGCVAISIAVNAPSSQVTAVELNPQTAEVTQRNIDQHQVSQRVDLRVGNLFDVLERGDRFEVIVSNPPYVRSDEIPGLQPDIRCHEPYLALDGGPDGLDVIRKIAENAGKYLKPGGWVLLELSPEQAEATQQLLVQHGFNAVGVKKDLAGKGRVVLGRKP